MIFRPTPAPADLHLLEAAVMDRLEPLRDDAPSPDAYARMRGALLSAAAAHHVAGADGAGLRPWHRAAIVSVAVAGFPLAAGGALAAMPGNDIVSGPGSMVSKVAGVFTGSGDGGSSALMPQEIDDEEENGSETTENGDGESNGTAVATTSETNDNDVGTNDANGDANGSGRSAARPGHEVCFAATENARARIGELLDREDISEEQTAGLENALRAIETCGLGAGDENADALEEEENGNEENGNGIGAQVCQQATAHARGVLESLRDRLPEDHPGRGGMDRAIEAVENCGAGNRGNGESEENGTDTESAAEGQSAGNRPDHAGPPAHAGPPENPGRPDHAAPPENPGGDNRPDHAGPPQDRPGSSAANSGNGGDNRPDHAGPPSNPGGGNDSQGDGPPAGRGPNR